MRILELSQIRGRIRDSHCDHGDDNNVNTNKDNDVNRAISAYERYLARTDGCRPSAAGTSTYRRYRRRRRT